MSAPAPRRPASRPAPNTSNPPPSAQFHTPHAHSPPLFASPLYLLVGLLGSALLFYFLMWDLVRAELEKEYGWKIEDGVGVYLSRLWSGLERAIFSSGKGEWEGEAWLGYLQGWVDTLWNGIGGRLDVVERIGTFLRRGEL